MRTAATMSTLLFLFACGSPKEDTGAEGPGTDGNNGACTDDDQCGDGTICESSACVAGDRDNSPEEATAIFYEEDHDGEINPEEDVDWWSVEGTGGTFLRVTTVGLTEGAVDTVVSLYDDAGHRLAWEDGYAGGTISGADTLLYAFVPENGTYFLKVEDIGTFYDDPDIPPAGSDKADYTLTVSEEGDGGNEPDSLQEAGGSYTIKGDRIAYPLPVLFKEEGDSDYFAIDLPFSDAPIYLFTMQHDDGSDASPELKLYNQAGDLVFQKLDPSRDDGAQLVGAQGTHYVVEVSDASGSYGNTHWGWVFVIIGAEGDGNPREQEPNNAVEQATALDAVDQQPDSGTYISYFTQGFVDDALDEDIYSFDLADDDMYISLALGAQTYGGLLVPRLEVLDSTGTVLQTVDSTAGTDEGALNLGPYPKGSYFLRVSATPDSGATGGEGYFYKVGIHTTSFQFSN